MLTINKQKLIIQKKDILIRPLRKSDVSDEYVNGLNDPDVNHYLVAVRQTRQTKESVTSYVEADWDNPLSILFGIFVKNDKNPFVGTIRVNDIDYFHFCACIGICLFAKRAWKKGYASCALQMIKKYLFENRQLHSLEAGVYAQNVNSISCFLNAGFVERYRVRNKYRHIDSFEDVIFLAAINPLFDSSCLKQPKQKNQFVIKELL